MRGTRFAKKLAGAVAAATALMCAPAAAADTCVSAASGAWEDAATWTGCSDEAPGADDAVEVATDHEIAVGAEHDVAQLKLDGVLSFTGGGPSGPSIDVAGPVEAAAGTLTGPGVLWSHGAFTKVGAGTLDVSDGAQVGFFDTATHVDGAICATGGARLAIQHRAYVVKETVSVPEPFSCDPAGSSGLFFNAESALVVERPGTTTFRTPVVLSGGGSLNVGSGQTIVLANGGRLGGNVSVGSAGTLTFNGDTDHPWASLTIAEGGTLDGTGDLALGGLATVDGRLAKPVTIGFNGYGQATLRGHGTVAGDVLNTSGRVQPGSSPGTLTIEGDYTQGERGKLELDVDGELPGTFDRLAVTGAATLGGTVAVSRAATYDPADSAVFPFLAAASIVPSPAALTGGGLPRERSFGLAFTETEGRLVVKPPPKPVATGQPAVEGAIAVGSTVTCASGTWTGDPSLTYGWRRDGAEIAEGQTYTIVPADAGRALTCRVTGTNTGGASSAFSVRHTVPFPPRPAPPSVKPSGIRPNAAERQLAVASRGTVATAFGLRRSTRCLRRSRGRVRLALRTPNGIRIATLVVHANGKRVRLTRRGVIYLANLRPKRRLALVLDVRTTSKLQLEGSRRYRICAAKRRR